MIITCIGDIHGRDKWKQIINDNPDSDTYVFLGDYFDSFTISQRNQLYNFFDIINLYEKLDKDRTKLIWGNHDLQYYFYLTSLFDIMKCSGFTRNLAVDIREQLIKHRTKLFPTWQIGSGENSVLFSHAGISKNYFDEYSKDIGCDYDLNNLSVCLNEAFERPGINQWVFNCGSSRGGSYNNGSFFWADRSETQYNMIGINQVIGHTLVDDVVIQSTSIDTRDYFNAYIDCVEYGNSYLNLKIKNNKITTVIKTIKENSNADEN